MNATTVLWNSMIRNEQPEKQVLQIQQSNHQIDLDQEGHSPAHAGPYHTPKDVPHSNANGWEQVQNAKPKSLL